MKASLLWPIAMLIIVVVGFGFALEHHRQQLNEELQRADQEAAALQKRDPWGTRITDPVPEYLR